MIDLPVSNDVDPVPMVTAQKCSRCGGIAEIFAVDGTVWYPEPDTKKARLWVCARCPECGDTTTYRIGAKCPANAEPL